MVEHHPDIIKSADWIIDLGPESGDHGGELVALGTPEEVAQVKLSYTGILLHELFCLRRPETLSRTGFWTSQSFSLEPIRLQGVSTHNLKNINVEIPVNQLTVITGVSGSGKSSLAFDTIFAECQQRFMSGFSTYARQMLGSTARAEMESCTGLMPAIAISRKTAVGNPRSTVGTMTEIYDYYRLLFARVGQPKESFSLTLTKPLQSGMFSFNHHQGACPLCKGLGFVTACDPRKLVTNPDRSLLDGALSGSKTGAFYGDPYGQYTAILQTVGEEKGIDFSRPWHQLDENARHMAMYGTGEKKYNVTWKFKRKNRVGEHRFERPWQGFVNYVNEEYQRKHADKRGEAMLSLMSDQTCPQCQGQRLKPEVLAIYFAGVNIAQLSSLSVKKSIEFFRELEQTPNSPNLDLVSERDLHITRDLRQEVVRRLEFMRDVGLEYLTLDRSSASLSGGEAQRIRLTGQLGSGLTGIIYVLDEPTIGLHSRDTQRLLQPLYKLRDLGNTVIVVEHDADIIRAADHIIDLGPGAGRDGGFIVAQGTVNQIMENKASSTGKYLKDSNAIPVPVQRRSLGDGLKIKGAFANNLKHIDIHIPSGGLTAITGVSGSGKSSLLFDVAAASAEAGFPVNCEAIEGFHHFAATITMDQTPIGATASSNPATYTGLFDKIRDLFAQTETARARGYKKNHFSFNVKGGRCETCKGMGEIHTSMDFMADVWTPCEECKGQRYNQETLECKFQEKNIADVLNMTIHEALDFFSPYKDICRILEQMEEVGLGYLQLGQPANTLSGGEAQRLKLVTELIKGKSKNNLYFFDEPTTGLHFEDIKRLLALFHRLIEAGHTLVVIEHHPDIIKNADLLIELGPGGGDDGGHAARAPYL